MATQALPDLKMRLPFMAKNTRFLGVFPVWKMLWVTVETTDFARVFAPLSCYHFDLEGMTFFAIVDL